MARSSKAEVRGQFGAWFRGPEITTIKMPGPDSGCSSQTPPAGERSGWRRAKVGANSFALSPTLLKRERPVNCDRLSDGSLSGAATNSASTKTVRCPTNVTQIRSGTLEKSDWLYSASTLTRAEQPQHESACAGSRRRVGVTAFQLTASFFLPMSTTFLALRCLHFQHEQMRL